MRNYIWLSKLHRFVQLMLTQCLKKTDRLAYEYIWTMPSLDWNGQVVLSVILVLLMSMFVLSSILQGAGERLGVDGTATVA
jgi:hypothetical protein